MSDTKRAANKYLEECGSACPHCGRGDQMRRDISSGRSRQNRPSGAQRSIIIPCHCAACAGGWDEEYELKAVGLLVKRGGVR